MGWVGQFVPKETPKKSAAYTIHFTVPFDSMLVKVSNTSPYVEEVYGAFQAIIVKIPWAVA